MGSADSFVEAAELVLHGVRVHRPRPAAAAGDSRGLKAVRLGPFVANEPARGRERDESSTRRDVQFAPDARSVPFGRSYGDVEAVADLAVGVAAREQDQDLTLAGGEKLGVGKHQLDIRALSQPS